MRTHAALHAVFQEFLYKFSHGYGATHFPRALFTTSKPRLLAEMLALLEKRGVLTPTLEKQSSEFVKGLRHGHSFKRDYDFVVWASPSADDYALAAEASHVAFAHYAAERGVESGKGLSETADFLAQFLVALETRDKKKQEQLQSLANTATRCFEHAATPFDPRLQAVGVQAAVNQLYGTCVASEAVREGFNTAQKVRTLMRALASKDFYKKIGRPPKMLSTMLKAATTQRAWHTPAGRAHLEHVLQDRLAETRAIQFIHVLARKY